MKTTNQRLLNWVNEMATLCKPDAIHWCDGTEEENIRLCDQAVAAGTFTRLDESKRPNSFLVMSDPADVARDRKSVV